MSFLDWISDTLDRWRGSPPPAGGPPSSPKPGPRPPRFAPSVVGQVAAAVRAAPLRDPVRFDHYSEVPAKAWRWPNFAPQEIACRGTGQILIVPVALDALQALRDSIGKPMVVTSAYRSRVHNARVGGAPASRHMEGDAFDIVTRGHDRGVLLATARSVGFTGFGFYPTFLHIDLGPPRSWGSWE